MQVGVGYSEEADSREAGIEAAENAMEALEGDPCTLALLFSTASHDPAALSAGVREIIGESAQLAGGYAVGIITNEELGYDGYQVGIALFSSSEEKLALFSQGPLPHNEQSVGAALGDVIEQSALSGDKSSVILYDSVNRGEGYFNLNMAVPLLEGLSQSMSEENLSRMVGAGLVGDMGCQSTYQWFGDEINQGTALAMVAGGGVSMHTTILHGCRPVSDYHTVTKSDGPALLEIDERPALEVIGELLGKESEISWKEYSFFVTLGVNMGEKYGDFKEEEYANRMCLRADIKRNALVMFEPDLVPGSQFQLMSRRINMDDMQQRVQDLLDTIPEDETPCFALYIDCAGRASAYCGADEEEAVGIIEALGGEIPLLGFYSGVEIGQIKGKPASLDWTGVLAIFSEKQ